MGHFEANNCQTKTLFLNFKFELARKHSFDLKKAAIFVLL